jgi:hypothetical protein
LGTLPYRRTCLHRGACYTLEEVIMNIENAGLLVVDLQPAYSRTDYGSSISAKLMDAVIAHIRELPQDCPVLVLHVNEELSGDTLEDVHEFWLRHGADIELIERCTWAEKSYAFARGWMDNGVNEEEIVQTMAALRRQGRHDSRDMRRDELAELSDRGAELFDPLFLDYDVEALLPRMRGQPWKTCGGGRDECLAEVELVLRSAKIVFERLDALTY